jgi:hypothetical protein
MDGAARLRLARGLRAFQLAARRLRIGHETDRLLTVLGGIADRELRFYRFAEHLRDRSPTDAGWMILRLWERVALGEGRIKEICLGLLDVRRLQEILGPSNVQAVREAMAANGEAGAVLLDLRGRRADAEEDDAVPRPKEPVGYRISLARRPIRRLLDRLLFDPDARVIRNVLGNPRLIEADVVALAASRRASAEVLEVIAQDSRWITRYPVRLALASNPAAPAHLVVSLLPYLFRQDLRAVASSSPRQDIRAHAQALLERQLEG